jgi:hypothetical protein
VGFSFFILQHAYEGAGNVNVLIKKAIRDKMGKFRGRFEGPIRRGQKRQEA